MRFLKRWEIRLEFKLEDMWMGTYWRRSNDHLVAWLDVWICVLPCLPIHITVYPKWWAVLTSGEDHD